MCSHSLVISHFSVVFYARNLSLGSRVQYDKKMMFVYAKLGTEENEKETLFFIFISSQFLK